MLRFICIWSVKPWLDCSALLWWSHITMRVLLLHIYHSCSNVFGFSIHFVLFPFWVQSNCIWFVLLSCEVKTDIIGNIAHFFSPSTQNVVVYFHLISKYLFNTFQNKGIWGDWNMRTAGTWEIVGDTERMSRIQIDSAEVQGTTPPHTMPPTALPHPHAPPRLWELEWRHRQCCAEGRSSDLGRTRDGCSSPDMFVILNFSLIFCKMEIKCAH